MLTNYFFDALNISDNDDLLAFSKKTNIPVSKLKMYNDERIFPFEHDLKVILKELNITELELKLRLGIFDTSTIKDIIKNSSVISKLLEPNNSKNFKEKTSAKPIYITKLGKLYQDDCLSIIQNIPENSVDLIFADPPFNLNKVYESNINDKLTKEEYLQWTEKWVIGCINILKEGGSLFIWNLSIWNTYISSILNKYLNFRHWISVDVKYQLPIPNKLYPSHYSLLYYFKRKKT
ncbi:DNA methyltransferase [Bacillus haynesii]|uniref:DNA methyltransferase n=1 Tax=Bacillus haynesii TaxID=1925021 RepID=UPI001EFBEBC0|nr:DNA methyltransferase [Bacillus haynesii]